jgi:biopolymer transport protein ExbB
MGMIAKGISEALITTETGLVIALPGLFFQHQLTRLYDRYKNFLNHLETVYTQRLFRKIQDQGSAALTV